LLTSYVVCRVLMLDAKMPLPEDVDLECFLPVNKALRFVQLLAQPTSRTHVAQN